MGSHWNTLPSICLYWIDISLVKTYCSKKTKKPTCQLVSFVILWTFSSQHFVPSDTGQQIAESQQCHRSLRADTKTTACKIREAGKTKMRFGAENSSLPGSSAVGVLQLISSVPTCCCPYSPCQWSMTILLMIGVIRQLSNGLNQQNQIQATHQLHTCVKFHYAFLPWETSNTLIK